MIDIKHQNRQRQYKLSQLAPLIQETIRHVLYAMPFARQLMAQGIRLTLDWTLLGPRSMRAVNREQRQIDQATDVLSFPARQMKEGQLTEDLEDWELMGEDPDRPSLFLGDLLLAPAIIEAQARDYGQSFEAELRLLVIHGVLHLLGYDHETDQEAQVMESLQEKLLLGLREIPCGFVALTGRPNVGKSTLLNELSDRTLAITSSKPQTTRHAIRSVLTSPDYQIALLDTPGLHKPKNALGKAMMKATTSAVGQADLVAVMVDAAWKPFVGQLELRIIQEAQKEGKPVILIINKVDGAPKENILPLIKAYDDLLKLDAYLPLSALTGDGIDRLLEEMARLLPIRRPLFDLDDETDQTERMLASELIRREVILQTDQEIPYGVSVLIERFEEIDPDEEERELAIDAVILCQRQAHKQILIGRGGDKIKSIGTAARRSIGQLLGARVHLSLFIKVRPDWQNKAQDLQAAGILGGD